MDLAGKIVRLRPTISKNKDGRVLPLSGELLEIVERANDKRRLDCPNVFHLEGQPVGDFKRSWATACKAAGVGKVLVHDLRRTAVRNMVRAGILDRVAMTYQVTRHAAYPTDTISLARRIWREHRSGCRRT